jgi:endonuclease YncB( thermonuclease family)
MFPDPRITSPIRTRVAAMLPWIFVAGVAIATTLPWRQWTFGRSGGHYGWGETIERPWPDAASEILWGEAGNSSIRHAVEVLRTIDGDTFLARVHLKSDLAIVTRVRLRGIDAPELKAACAREFQMAKAATDALRALLDEGSVTIFNVGPDKYFGRVDADAATGRTQNISSALLASGRVRRYDGGRRDGWCGSRG